MCKDIPDVETSKVFSNFAYYNLPRGKDRFRSYTCCDDENVRGGGNTSLPEQHLL